MPPPPAWLGRAIIATGAVVLIVGMLVLVLRLADDGDPDLGKVATVATTTSTTELATTTTEVPTTVSSTSTTVKATTTTVKKATTTTKPSVTTTAKPAVTTTTTASGGGFTANDVRYFSGNDGDFGGTAMITNNSSATKNGSFTIRLYRFDELVGTLHATKTMAGNTTEEVEFSSNDDYVAGVDRHEFSASAS